MTDLLVRLRAGFRDITGTPAASNTFSSSIQNLSF